ncbi:hypothetical protein NDU88_008426 [Pleurodeles waltl]|uniref:Uncharacterized protein n=1 Tax=Pleurodeles waltl TaxID=8319 RepID=A0AAV7QST0_PLEWA|nr:hypothetical protein NDU88_008426 [Pleurodeles waltl]
MLLHREAKMHMLSFQALNRRPGVASERPDPPGKFRMSGQSGFALCVPGGFRFTDHQHRLGFQPEMRSLVTQLLTAGRESFLRSRVCPPPKIRAPCLTHFCRAEYYEGCCPEAGS